MQLTQCPESSLPGGRLHRLTSPETLLDRGYSVIGIDNLLISNMANIAHLANRDSQSIKHDVTNYVHVEGPVDVVPYWANSASPIDYPRAADPDPGWCTGRRQGR